MSVSTTRGRIKKLRGQNTKLDMRTGLTAKAKINRNDFGLGRSMAVQLAASELATIEIELEAVQKPVEVRERVATPVAIF
jgi:polyisoprenoid-binding protein YceI